MSPRSKVQNEQIRKKSKEKITNSALKLFAEKGYQQVSVSEIAREANVAKGLIYNYFQSKDEILTDIIKQISSEMVQFMGALENVKDPMHRMENLIDLTFQLFREKKNFYQLVMPLLSQPVFSQEMKISLASFIKVLIQDIENSLDSIGLSNAKSEALKIGAMIDGIALHYLYVYRDKYPLDEMKIGIIEYIRNLKN